MTHQVGKFKVDVSGPYPCWVNIEDDTDSGNCLSGIRHTDLRDLQYAIERAIFECEQKLKEKL